MKIEIRTLKPDGIIQITTVDERWYQHPKTGGFFPSVTWITDSYPKGVHFYKWLADKGWDEAESIKAVAGNRGSKVHHAIEFLLKGNTILMDQEVTDSDGKPSPLTVQEYDAVISFAAWWKETNPTLIANEQVVFNDEYEYAGTLDMVCEIGGVSYLVDFKTSPNIWPSFELQLSAYNHALPKPAQKLAILQVSYGKNKKGFKFTEVEDKFDLFLAAKKIWHNENDGVFPKQKDYPASITL